MARNVVVQRMAPRARRTRSPQFPFQIRTRPFAITPMHISPVLPGETLSNFMLLSRSLTDPIKNRLVGWWQEFFFYYVKLSDLDLREEYVGLNGMLVDPSWSRTDVDDTTDDTHHYYVKGAGTGYINWVDQCLARVVTEYFRDEEDGWAYPNAMTNTIAGVVGTFPAAQRKGRDLFHSLAEEGAVTFTDVNVDLDANATITIGEIEQAKLTYEMLKNNFGMQMGYEQWLAQYGISTPKEVLHKPEELFTLSQWKNPISSIDPTDGSAASAVAWEWSERREGAWRFREPGFIFGVQVTRPKVFLSGQKGTATALMNDMLSWFPPHLVNDARQSLKLIPDLDLIGNINDANGAWVDLRDLLLYGEQFVNFSLADTEANLANLPSGAAGLNDRYVASADIDAMFVSASPQNQVRSEGMVTLNISTLQKDQTT